MSNLDNSNSLSESTTHDNHFSNSISMSIKDWACYATLRDYEKQSPQWIWGQEYPWDVIEFRNMDSNNHVILPEYIQNRLHLDIGKNKHVSPPSQLSLFGIDFISKASWIIRMENQEPDDNITFIHELEYVRGSHGMDGDKFFASLHVPTKEAIKHSSEKLDLSLLSLNPILKDGNNGAIIGFLENKFVVPPVENKKLKIISDANNLQVTGQGFKEPMYSDFSVNQATLQVNFKIIDSHHEYELLLKCWKTQDVGCILDININGNNIQKHVDSKENQGGENNLISILLRKKDYSVENYHDYLKMGLNTITINITPEKSGECGFEVRVLAIG